MDADGNKRTVSSENSNLGCREIESGLDDGVDIFTKSCTALNKLDCRNLCLLESAKDSQTLVVCDRKFGLFN